jgi:hypothetical protein
MTLVTAQDIGKFFTQDNNKTKWELTGINKAAFNGGCPILTLAQSTGGSQTVSHNYFVRHYLRAIVYPKRLTICACTTKARKTVLLYSGDEGLYYTSLDNGTLRNQYHLTHSQFVKVKEYKSC